MLERHADRCWCRNGDEWGTGWVCHPEAGLQDSLASRISVELIVEGSRFPRLLCSVWVMLSHRWFCPCRMLHATRSESATAACRNGSPTTEWRGQWSPEIPLTELFYSYLLNCPFNWWTHTADSHPPESQTGGGGGCIPSRQREPHVCMDEGPAHNCLFSSSWGKSKNLEKAKFENAMCLKIFLRKPSLRTPRALKWVLILENACFGEPSEPKAYLRSLRACALKRLPFLLGISVSLFFCQFLRSYMTSGQPVTKALSSLLLFLSIPSMQQFLLSMLSQFFCMWTATL